MTTTAARLLNKGESAFWRWLDAKPDAEIVGMAGLPEWCPLRNWLAESGCPRPRVGPKWVETEDELGTERYPTPEWMRAIIWRLDRWGDERLEPMVTAGELKALLGIEEAHTARDGATSQRLP